MAATTELANQLLKDDSKPVSFDKEQHLYLYAIARKDLEMPAGKLAAQAGHAYTDTLHEASKTNPNAVSNYRNDDLGGSKVTLLAKNTHHLMKAYIQAKRSGLPVSIVVDKEHVMPPHFDGNPIITAIGIGPCTRADSRHILKKFQVA